MPTSLILAPPPDFQTSLRPFFVHSSLLKVHLFLWASKTIIFTFSWENVGWSCGYSVKLLMCVVFEWSAKSFRAAAGCRLQARLDITLPPT